MNGKIKSKLVKLRKSRLAWETPTVRMTNPYAPIVTRKVRQGKGGTVIDLVEPQLMSVHTIKYKLPVDVINIETVLVGGKVVWDYQMAPARTAPLGGGGRFIHSREFADRKMVSQSITFRDIPFFNGKQDDIDVIVSVFVPGEPIK